jgi:hypothetical protein
MDSRNYQLDRATMEQSRKETCAIFVPLWLRAMVTGDIAPEPPNPAISASGGVPRGPGSESRGLASQATFSASPVHFPKRVTRLTQLHVRPEDRAPPSPRHCPSRTRIREFESLPTVHSRWLCTISERLLDAVKTGDLSSRQIPPIPGEWRCRCSTKAVPIFSVKQLTLPND